MFTIRKRAVIICRISAPEKRNLKKLWRNTFFLQVSVTDGMLKKLPDTPDIVLKKYKTVIFVNGCFWHMHEGCKYFVWPQDNAVFWRKKLFANKERDEKEQIELARLGWNVIVVWECELKKDKREATLQKLEATLRENRNESNKL